MYYDYDHGSTVYCRSSLTTSIHLIHSMHRPPPTRLPFFRMNSARTVCPSSPAYLTIPITETYRIDHASSNSVVGVDRPTLAGSSLLPSRRGSCCAVYPVQGRSLECRSPRGSCGACICNMYSRSPLRGSLCLPCILLRLIYSFYLPVGTLQESGPKHRILLSLSSSDIVYTIITLALRTSPCPLRLGSLILLAS